MITQENKKAENTLCLFVCLFVKDCSSRYIGVKSFCAVNPIPFGSIPALTKRLNTAHPFIVPNHFVNQMNEVIVSQYIQHCHKKFVWGGRKIYKLHETVFVIWQENAYFRIHIFCAADHHPFIFLTFSALTGSVWLISRALIILTTSRLPASSSL